MVLLHSFLNARSTDSEWWLKKFLIGSKSSSAEVKCSALFVFAVPCVIISPLKFSLGIKLYNSIPYEEITMTFRV